MSHEILRDVWLRPPLRVTHLIGQDRSQQGSTSLYTHANMKRAALPLVFHPRMELTQAQVFLRLRDGAAADSGEDEFVPELVEVGELVVFPRLFTS